jgi:AI-2 transport protein TqsA
VLLAVIFILLEVPGHTGQAEGGIQSHRDWRGATEAAARQHQPLHADQDPDQPRHRGLCLAVAVVFGIDFAILWAVIAFFLNFVPVVGNIVMMIPAVLLALVQVGLATALMVAAGYLVINTAIGNVIEPRIMGKGLGISTLAVFIALLFWGWLFGTDHRGGHVPGRTADQRR